MARAIWTGSISFGLVNIPVGLYSAVSEKTIRFNQLEKGTSDRIRYKRVNENTGEEVDYADIVKGYDVGDGRYVVLTQKELEAVEPTGSRTIEIEDFVDQAEIDPIFYSQTYYVAPKTDAAARPYALLIEAMRQSGKVAIARFVMRTKEHLAALRADGDVLALETMYFADEIRDPLREVEVRPGGEPPRERELSTAVSLIESMSEPWDPTKYRDRYRERVESLIEERLEGREVLEAAEPRRDTNVVDLMDALRRSVDQARGSRGGAGETPGGAGTRRGRAAGGARDGSTPSDGQVGAGAGEESGRSPQRGGTRAAHGAAGRTSKRAAPASGGRSDGADRQATRRRRGGREPQGEQLSMMSREELYQLAQDIKVPGRSKMSRDELEAAVADARARQAS